LNLAGPVIHSEMRSCVAGKNSTQMDGKWKRSAANQNLFA